MNGENGRVMPEALDCFGRPLWPLADKKVFLLDMDGTLYEGERLFPWTKAFLKSIAESGGRFVFITNNSSRSVADYQAKLARLGQSAAVEQFYTSAQAAAALFLREYPGAKVFCLGTKALVEELSQAGLRVTTEAEADVDVVLLAYDTELTYRKLEKICELLRRGLPYLATNCDWVCPIEGGFVPDCGSFAQMLEHATGRLPRFIGKPEPDMLRYALARLGAEPEEALVIGDRLYTDIESGRRAGVDTLLVLSGETRAEDLIDAKVRADYTLEHIGQLLEVFEKMREGRRDAKTAF